MNIGKMNNWLQVMANVGIVGGLVLVGFQLKQNSELLKTQLLYEESDRSIELETKVVGEDAARVWAKSITDPKNLTLSEQRIMEALLWSFTEQLRATRLLAELGLLENEEWRLRVYSEVEFYFGNQYGVAWWRNFSEDNEILPQDLVDAVNEQLAQTPPNLTESYMRSTMEFLDMPPNDNSINAD